MPSGRRKKLPEEYSTNPNTIRARKRKARLSPFSKEVEQAKASDAKALTRAWKQRYGTETYKMASEEERKNILAFCEEEVMNRRLRLPLFRDMAPVFARQKGLDADSKINRFIGRMESEKPGGRTSRSTVSSGTSNAPIGPLDPALSPMRPAAAMGPPLSQVSRGYCAPPNPYNSYNSHQVLPSIEGGMYTESPFPSQGHMFNTSPKHGHYHQPMHSPSFGPHSHFNHMHPQVHDDEAKYQLSAMGAAPDAFRKAQVPRDMDDAVQKIAALEKRIKTLETDLAVAKTTMAAQGDRMNKLDNRMKEYDTTIKGVSDAERKFKVQSSLLERVVQGVQRIADVAAEVAYIMRSGDLGDRPRPHHGDNEDGDDDSGISPDKTMA